MVLRALFAPITGLAWIAEQIQERADSELDDQENLNKRLLVLQLAFDMGDIAEDEFEQQEEELLLAIQALADEAHLAAGVQ
ncbi:gas vesicle protein GvpG [Myxacorys almedinensis]|uniref:Gas vesicle protein GvpG n=1 Tax=Myxacorys almedinensis A TaxID=2690445 RepID=A0A8J7Z4D6_9CYAN|nr:gas vesicle protein GvpG [Myxacorys almedinensis]NDJ19784.1 gas vesicle protein GvpG [Myxacorys almedinensis A]